VRVDPSGEVLVVVVVVGVEEVVIEGTVVTLEDGAAVDACAARERGQTGVHVVGGASVEVTTL